MSQNLLAKFLQNGLKENCELGIFYLETSTTPRIFFANWPFSGPHMTYDKGHTEIVFFKAPSDVAAPHHLPRQKETRDLGVAKPWGHLKWMVYNGKSHLEMDDNGGTPISGNLQMGSGQCGGVVHVASTHLPAVSSPYQKQY